MSNHVVLTNRRRLERAQRELEQMQHQGHRQRRRCKCGVCTPCLEEARWDRIFNEKFADPTYYSRGLVVRCSSPLDSL